MPEQVWSTGEIANLFKLTDTRIRQMVAEGKLRVAYVTQGGKRIFRAEEVERLRRQREAA